MRRQIDVILKNFPKLPYIYLRKYLRNGYLFDQFLLLVLVVNPNAKQSWSLAERAKDLSICWLGVVHDSVIPVSIQP